MEILKNGVDRKRALQLHEQYLREHHVLLPNFLDSFLAHYMRTLFQQAPLDEYYKNQAGKEYVGIDYSFNEELIKVCNYLTNQERYIEFLSLITGHNDIGRMQGHLYVSDSSAERGYGYHSDHDGNRYFLTSTNISERPYSGGVFTLRNSKTKELFFSVQNNSPGGMLIAKIGDDFEHMVSHVTGDVTRLTLLSWALIEPKMKRFRLF